MSQSATVPSVRRAGRLIKRLMNFLPEGWVDTKEQGREALRRTIEEGMVERVRGHLEDSRSRGLRDRRNGSFRRHLVTGLGDIELADPRTPSDQRSSTKRWAAPFTRRTQ